MPDNQNNSDAAMWAAAGQIGASALNYAASASANRKGRRWAEQQYARERADALADWNMQNEYNSPAAQMARLKAGGLNPNLVYGDGANSPAVNIRGADAQWKPEANRLDVGGAANALMASVGLRNTEAQTDNLKKQRELIDQQILNTAANTQNIGQQTETSKFNLEQLQKKAATDIAIQEANLTNLDLDAEQKRANTQYTLDNNQRQALVNAQNLLKGLQEIQNLRSTDANIRQSTLNAETQGAILKLDEALKRAGIQPHDPAYIRLGQKLIQAMPTPQRFKQIVDSTARQLLRQAEKKANNYRNSLLPSN